MKLLKILSIHFWTCYKISDLWIKLGGWIYNQTQMIIPFDTDIVLFGNFGNKGIKMI